MFFSSQAEWICHSLNVSVYVSDGSSLLFSKRLCANGIMDSSFRIMHQYTSRDFQDFNPHMLDRISSHRRRHWGERSFQDPLKFCHMWVQPLTGTGLWGRPPGSLRHLLHKVGQKGAASRRGFSCWTSPQVPKPRTRHVSCWSDGNGVRVLPRTLFLHFCFLTLPQPERDVASSRWGMCICPQHRNSPQQNHPIWGSQTENDLSQTKNP